MKYEVTRVTDTSAEAKGAGKTTKQFRPMTLNCLTSCFCYSSYSVAVFLGTHCDDVPTAFLQSCYMIAGMICGKAAIVISILH